MNNPVIAGNMRFTVIRAECVRMEFSPEGRFRDEPTLFVPSRDLSFTDFTAAYDGKEIKIETPNLKIVYNAATGRPKSGTLNVFTGGEKWWYSKGNPETLGGPVQSLDGCDRPIPLGEGLISRSGYHVVDDSRAAVLKDGWLTADPREEGYFDLYFFAYGTDYKAGLRALTAVSGKVPMLPKWCMGSWYSRWYAYTSADYRGIEREYAEHGFPLDVMVMDMEWHTRGGDRGFGWAGTLGWTGWSWNRELLPDAEKLMEEFKSSGLRVAMNVHPCDGIRSHETCYADFMKAMNESTENGRALPFDAGNRDYMANYFKYAHAPYEKLGCSIWWVDWQQDCIYPHVAGVPGTPHVPWLNELYYRHMCEGGRRGAAFSRWGGWGDQRHPIHFSGDTTAKWEVLAFQIAFTSASGNTGCFFWTHDMGGFCGERNEELYARWLQFGAVSAAMRLHSAGDDLDRRPWKWASPYTESMRNSFELRAKLMPYLYTAMRNACRDSVPMIESLYLEHPEREEAYRNPQEFYLGSDMLAAPVATPGDGARKTAFQRVWIPGGEWFQFFTGERIAEGESLAAADLFEMPLFVRGGIPVPLGIPGGKRLGGVCDAFEIMLFPSEKGGSFRLYEDDGVTDQNEQGEFSETEFTSSWSDGILTIRVGEAEGSFEGAPETRSFSLLVRNAEKASEVRVNGKKISFQADPSAKTLRTEPIRISRKESLTFEIAMTFGEGKANPRRTEGASERTLALLSGKGVWTESDPLTGKKRLLVRGDLEGLMEKDGSSFTLRTKETGSGLFELPYPAPGERTVFRTGNAVFEYPEKP